MVFIAVGPCFSHELELRQAEETETLESWSLIAGGGGDMHCEQKVLYMISKIRVKGDNQKSKIRIFSNIPQLNTKIKLKSLAIIFFDSVQ